jgi:hypothetical protein
MSTIHTPLPLPRRYLASNAIRGDRRTRLYFDRFTGALVGTACGDAMGLTVEGQAPSAGERHATRLRLAQEQGEAAVPYFSQVYGGPVSISMSCGRYEYRSITDDVGLPVFLLMTGPTRDTRQ